MAKMGRPKVDNPINHMVTVKFREEEYQLMLEYAENHNLSISQIIRLGVERRERWLVEKMAKAES